jgi:hypothetical protein
MESDSPENGSSFIHTSPGWFTDLLGQDGRPSTDGGLVVLLLYAHVKNLPWEYDFEFDVLQVVEADNSWPETATWVNYVCMYV